jgi:hypothetical protein
MESKQCNQDTTTDLPTISQNRAKKGSSRSTWGYFIWVMAFAFLTACGGGGGPGPVPPGPGPEPSSAGTISKAAGKSTVGGVEFENRSGALLKDIAIAVSDTEAPAPLPVGLKVVSTKKIDVSSSDQETINGPLKLKLTYNDAGIANEEDVLVLHYHPTGGYEPVRLLAQDVSANTVTFETRAFSSFVIAVIDSLLPTSFSTGFSAPSHGWNIANFGSYFATGGNCLGMSAYSVWHYNQGSSTLLHSAYTNDIARLTAIRAHLAQSQTWAKNEWRVEQALGNARLGRTMKAYLSLLKQPLILLLGTNGKPAHASVVYGYDESKFLFYDVNFPDTEQAVSFNGSTFGTYGGYDSFGYVGLPSLGRTEDFGQLTSEANGGFASSQNISVASPSQGQSLAARSAPLMGTLSGPLNPLTKLYVEVKGVGREVPVSGGAFNDTVEISRGENTIVLLAGVDIANQSNWYKNGATLVREVGSTLPASALFITLSWDQPSTDVDLYVTEPNGETAWYRSRSTASGTGLDFDNTNGFGPEHVTLNGGAGIQAGEYSVRVHYYGGSAGVTGRVHMVVNEGTANQVVKEVPFSIGSSNSANQLPGSSGADWVDIGKIDIVNNTIN